MPDDALRRRMGLCILTAFFLVTGHVGPARAEHPVDAALEACREKALDTVSISQCTAKALTQWDQELNLAYKALMDALPPEARTALTAAQREWIRFRDADAAFIRADLAAQDGTIWSPTAGSYILDLTRKRAIQLRCYAKMTEMEGPADPLCP